MRGMNDCKDDNKFNQLCSNKVGRLQCSSKNFDKNAGPIVDTLYFDFDGQELMFSNTFYGSTYTLNPGPGHSRFDQGSLSQEEKAYIWECIKTSGIYI